MTTTVTPAAGTPGLDAVLAEAARTAGRGGDLAVAAGQVVVRRVALGVAAAFDPLQADHAEFARMVPEKVEAFSAAGRILMEGSDQAGREIVRLASDEIMAATRATLAMAGCATPAALGLAQGRFALDWFDRAASALLRMAMVGIRAQAAAMAPIHDAVASNTERLGA